MKIYDSYINLFMDAKANVGDILTVNYKDGKSKDFVFFRYYDEINYCTESGYKLRMMAKLYLDLVRVIIIYL